MAKTVYTLTGNLLAERTLVFAEWTPGRTQRARQTSFQVGGKGINVAKMLRRLPGVRVEAWCFAGGESGDECLAWLAGQGLPHRAFRTTVHTRSGLVVRSANQPETTFLGPDAAPGPAALQACADYLDSLPDGEVLALCGSFPGWADDATLPLREALARWARRGILYVDTYGAPLEWAIGQPVHTLKINRDEFDLLAGRGEGQPLRDRVQAHARASAIRAWIITDGRNEGVYVEKNGESGTFRPPVVEEVSPTGSGDVFLAALIHAREIEGRPLGAAVGEALLYGAANAAHPGVAEFDLNQVQTLRSHLP